MFQPSSSAFQSPPLHETRGHRSHPRNLPERNVLQSTQSLHIHHNGTDLFDANGNRHGHGHGHGFKSRRNQLGKNGQKRNSDYGVNYNSKGKKKHSSVQIDGNSKKRKDRKRRKAKRAKNKLMRSASMDDRPPDPQQLKDRTANGDGNGSRAEKPTKSRKDRKRHTTTNITGPNKRKSQSGYRRKTRKKKGRTMPKSENFVPIKHHSEPMTPLELGDDPHLKSVKSNESALSTKSNKKVRFNDAGSARSTGSRTPADDVNTRTVDDFIGDLKVFVGPDDVNNNNSNNNSNDNSQNQNPSQSSTRPPKIGIGIQLPQISINAPIDQQISAPSPIQPDDSRITDLEESKQTAQNGVTPTHSITRTADTFAQQRSLESPNSNNTYTQSMPPEPAPGPFALKLAINTGGSREDHAVPKIAMRM